MEQLMGSVKLTFLCGQKRVSQSVPLQVAQQIPLFNYGIGFAEEAEGRFFFAQPTTLKALELYWRYYKKTIPIPLSASLQDRADFLKLVTYLQEPLNDEGIPGNLWVQTTFVCNDFNHHLVQLDWDFSLCIRLYSAGGFNLSLFRTNVFDVDDVYFALGAHRCNCALYASKRQIIYDDTISGAEYNESFEIVKRVGTPREFFQQSAQPISNRIENIDEVLTLQMVCKRLTGKRFPKDVLNLILGPFYEDWNSTISANFADFSDSAQASLINEYLTHCFGSQEHICAKWETFMTLWPQMAKYVWENANRAELVVDLNIPTKRRSGFIQQPTVEGVLEYLQRIYNQKKTIGVAKIIYDQCWLKAQEWSKILFKRK